MNAVRIGCVKYLNARPLVHGWEGDVCFDHPAVLCRRLASGQLDVALVSSFELLRNPIYRIVDRVSICSHGPVYSVIVAHRGDISDVAEIELDPASETSVSLLRCLLAETGLHPRLVPSNGDILSVGRLESEHVNKARLLIGDQAIRFRLIHGSRFHFWDLGEQWKKLTGLPFVYALWLVRPEVADPGLIASRLRDLRDKNLAALDELIRETAACIADRALKRTLENAFLSHYYRKHLQFGLGEMEKQGLRTFARLCAKHALLPPRPLAFRFV